MLLSQFLKKKKVFICVAKKTKVFLNIHGYFRITLKAIINLIKIFVLQLYDESKNNF